MRVLITGGAGFIGSHLTDRLLARGDDVLAIDNFATARHDNLGEHERLELIEGTIVDPQLVNKAFSDFEPEVVAHAAASYKDPDDWTEDSATNAGSTIVPSTRVSFSCSDRLSRRAVAKLSITSTSSPRTSSRSARCEPMKPAPPVISTRIRRFLSDQ